MATFDYPATLYIVHQWRGYYDCVWKSHVRISAPATIYQQDNVLVSECALMKLTRTVRDPLIRLRHLWNHGVETNYSTTTVVGKLT